MHLRGLHHVTAVTADVRTNHRFYTLILGMRLVKRSVNQDDVGAYHLFYADAIGSPGTDLTFFDWRVGRERRGGRSIIRTALRVDGGDTLDWWANRFDEYGIARSAVTERDGRPTLDFHDPEGQRLSLVDDAGTGDSPEPWNRSPVPTEYQIRGLGPVVLSVPDPGPTDVVLTEVMQLRRTREYRHPDHQSSIRVYEMGDGGAHAEVHVATHPDSPPARLGAGGVHHVAFRVQDEAEHRAWLDRLNRIGIPNSGLVDRYYFRSLYFREPNGILFEIATDGPGFAVDEDVATLGESLALPPFLEQQREAIVANLKPIESEDSR